MIVESLGIRPFQNGNHTDMLSMSVERMAIDPTVQGPKEMTEIPGGYFGGECDTRTIPTLEAMDPLFQREGDSKRVMPMVDVDPLTEVFLKVGRVV